MATTTATISINSNIMGYPIGINKTMTMKKLQSSTGLEETTGLRTKKFTATTATVVIEQDEFEDTKASKVYMRNTGTDKTKFFYVAKHASAAAADTDGETIGKLYGNDWMLIPYAADVNITVAPSTAETMTLEYMVFVE
tara:strand:+ start:1989 stop:2405 length:417 start_codon:yes stop_codon:yes gene_type:complete